MYTVFTNVVTTVPRNSVREVVYGDWLLQIAQSQLVRPEQKSVLIMKNVRCKFLNRGQFVLEALAEMLSMAKACLLLDKHRQFIGSNRYLNFLQKSMQSLIHNCAFQLLKDRSYLAGVEHLK